MLEEEKIILIQKSKLKGECMPIDIEIDSLTNCLIETKTGKEFDTTFSEIRRTITKKQANELIKNGWCFDWNVPHKEGKQVYGLYVDGSDEVQGLIALEHHRDDFYTYVSLVESSPKNRIDKVYSGVGGHLFAIACKLSFDVGNDGYVMFVPKTKLIDHYRKTLNAELIADQKMVIKTQEAINLIKKYFKEASL